MLFGHHRFCLFRLFLAFQFLRLRYRQLADCPEFHVQAMQSLALILCRLRKPNQQMLMIGDYHHCRRERCRKSRRLIHQKRYQRLVRQSRHYCP